MICGTINSTLENKAQPETKIKFYNTITPPLPNVWQWNMDQDKNVRECNTIILNEIPKRHKRLNKNQHNKKNIIWDELIIYYK